VTIDISVLSRKELNKSPYNKNAKNASNNTHVTAKNNKQCYEFDPENDIKHLAEKDTAQLSLKINVPDMLKKGIEKIRVIVTNKKIDKIVAEYDNKILVDDFEIVSSDLYNVKLHDTIVDSGKLSSKNLSNFSEIRPKKKQDDIVLTKKIIEKRSSIGEAIESNSDFLNELFLFNEQPKEVNKTVVVEDNFVISKNILRKRNDLKANDSVFITIVELSRKDNAFKTASLYDNWKILSVGEFKVNKYYTIIKRFKLHLDEKSNILKAVGTNNKNMATHLININNEKTEKLYLQKKTSINDNFKNITVKRLKNSFETIKVKEVNPAIYRIIDSKGKISDTFVGDVNKSFFTSKPTVSAFLLEKSIRIIVNNVPLDYEKFIVERFEGSNRTSLTEINVEKDTLIDGLPDNMLIFVDNDTEHNKLFTYQIKFLLKNGSTINTSISNRQIFIKPSGVFSLVGKIKKSKDGNSLIEFKTSVPGTDSKELFSSIQKKFPALDESQTSSLIDNYSNLTFVKLMSLNKTTGTIKTIKMQAATDDVVSFDLKNSSYNNNIVYFGELFSSSLIQVLENINATSPFNKGKNDYLPSFSLDLKQDINNFRSKFLSFSSINDGTLTYGKSLVEKPGTLIEASKTGVVTLISEISPKSTIDNKTMTSKIYIEERNVPAIKIKCYDKKVKSILIVTSSKNGRKYRTERALHNKSNAVTFYDIEANTCFSDEIIDYYAITVYNNYVLNDVIRLGTVICSKDNFRVL